MALREGKTDACRHAPIRAREGCNASVVPGRRFLIAPYSAPPHSGDGQAVAAKPAPMGTGYPADRRLPGCNRVTGRDTASAGFHPAIVRAHSRALALSVMPGSAGAARSWRTSSPSSSNTRRMAADSDSVTLDMESAWRSTSATGKRLVPGVLDSAVDV